MSEPLSNVNTPLSYKLGIYRKEAHDPRLCIPEDWKGYNKCVRDLDQLSPDVEALKKILHDNFDSFFHQVHFYIEIEDWYNKGIEKSAQEIINKMSVWLVKKG